MQATHLCAGLAMLAANLFGQTATAPAFEVASVRENRGAPPREPPFLRSPFQISPGSFIARNASLKFCIQWAFRLTEYQVQGPDWIADLRYDIAAKAGDAAKEAQLRAMLQTLLAERFKLATHHETKVLSAFALHVGKDGPKFHESSSEGESSIEPNLKEFKLVVQRARLSQLVDMLAMFFRAPIIDQTGLEGRYDITLNILKFAEKADGANPYDLIMRGLEEAGLKLEAKKMAVDLLVIDHAEKQPAEN